MAKLVVQDVLDNIIRNVLIVQILRERDNLHQDTAVSEMIFGNLFAGKPDGIGTYWDMGGDLVYVGQFSRGEITGRGKTFYPNGGVHVDGQFLGKKPHGKVSVYDPYGNVVYDGNCGYGKANIGGT